MFIYLNNNNKTMKHPKLLLLAGLLFFMQNSTLMAQTAHNPIVQFSTDKGDFTVVLYPKEAPITVKNFLRYAKEGDYNNTIFHRIVKSFVIQGGGFTPKLERKETYRPIKNEADNSLSNVRGSIAMARLNEPDSATNQFYINLVDNSSALDSQPSRPGYTVFGKVIDGIKVIDEIGNLPTVRRVQFRSAPNPLVTIKKVQILQPSPENIKKYQPHLSPKDILKTSSLRSYSPINPYTKDISKIPDGWREKLKLQMYIWIKPFFPGYATESYKKQ